jgi:hypothetical protein
VSLEKLTGMRLLDFIRDSYQLEISGQHKNIYAIVLSEANLPAVRFLDKSTPPRYNRRFWAAFGIPLGNDERRYLNVETMEFGSDKEALGDASADIREIGPDFINKERERLDPQLVAENVEKWLSQESLEPSRFTVGSKHANRAPRSVLDAMFLTLSQDDLRRITLPLDIVRKLLDKQNI